MSCLRIKGEHWNFKQLLQNSRMCTFACLRRRVSELVLPAVLEGCQPGLQGMERPPDSSWELADSLMQTLSAPLPPDSPVAASYKDMMHQLKADVTSALMACTHQDSVPNAVPLQSSQQLPCKGFSANAGYIFHLETPALDQRVRKFSL